MSDQTPELKDNPLLSRAGLPLFEQIEPSHVIPAIDHILEVVEASFQNIEKVESPSWDTILRPLELLDEKFYRVWGQVSHLLSVQNSEALREAHQAVLPKVIALGLKMNQSEKIYNALKQIKEGDAWAQLDGPQKRIVESKLLDAELSGVALEGDKKERFNELSKELSKLGTDFSNNKLDSIKAFSLILTKPEEVAGLPPTSLQSAASSYNEHKEEGAPEATPENGPWRITLDGPSYRGFMKHAKNRELRKQLYTAFIQIASSDGKDNTPLINQILKLRQEKAALLGFSNYAEVSLAQKMAPSVDEIKKLLEDLRGASWDPANEEYIALQNFAGDAGQEEQLAHWDISFWSERLREKTFDYKDEELRPYFPLPQVLKGLFELVYKLFGIQVKDVSEGAPKWHPDVQYFQIDNADGEHIANFYLDPYTRPEDKRGGAWMNDCLCRYVGEDGDIQKPVAYLVCNGTKPVGGKPSLMTFREVETLLHEFGHGLQHMLTQVDYLEASGINGIEWDAVELPSQFMENWCYHKPSLLKMTKHVDTGEVLPDALFEKLKAARTFRAATGMLTQIRYGLVDLTLHHSFDPNGDKTIYDIENELIRKTSLMPPLSENRFLCQFSHIFAGGYAAGYFSYKWAEVLSADAFSAFEEVGLDQDKAIQEKGISFRDTVLAKGGGQHPMEVFEEFRGRKPTTDALLRHSGLQ